MVAENIGRQELAALITPAIISSLSTFIPIENIISRFWVPRSFVWYIPWRGAIVSFILWLISGFFFSEEKRLTKMFFAGSAVSLVTFHYWTILVESLQGFNVSLYPLFYMVGKGGAPILDIGQVAIIFTLIAFYKDIKNALAEAFST